MKETSSTTLFTLPTDRLAEYNSKDGPPVGPHPTSYKKAIPTVQPYSRYGNRAQYLVDGKKYEVLPSAKGYRAKGIASWYGMKFHSKKTSSGEPYNLYEMTAAHKTLPLPTYVKVTNLNNGKALVVKVNDRGPFHNDRIIDLSYGAAKKLGILAKGTAPVEVEAITPSGAAQEPLQYFLQAGAFNKREQANQLMAKIASQSSAPLFIEHFNNYFVVKAGPFKDRKSSEAFKRALSLRGIKDAFMVLQ